MSKELIRLVDCVMEFDGETVLNSINLYINDAEFLTLLGPSGCGKTTTLRIIGGFLKPTSGDVIFDGERINNLPPHKRQVNTIFQKYALFTHLNIDENVALGLRSRKTPEDEVRRLVDEALSLVNLSGYQNRRVNSLSGGQQQRVAIARAIVNRPKVLLLDEPLGALDLKLRKSMQVELKKIQREVGITFIYVTHDQEEALTMSDTIVVMNNGSIQQIGTPIGIYNEPKNAFVANFIGESNIVEGTMLRDGLVRFSGREFPCMDGGFGTDCPVDVVVRPDDLHIVRPEEGMLRGVVESVIFKGIGSHYEMMVKSPDFTWKVQSNHCYDIGDEIGMYLSPYDIHAMHKSCGCRL